MNPPSVKPLKLTPHQVALLRECVFYPITEVRSRRGGTEYLRLGGYGCAPLRYVYTSMLTLKAQGLVSDYRATQKGRDYLATLIPLTP